MEARALLPRDLRLHMGDLGVVALELELSEEGRARARDELGEADHAVPDAFANLRALLQGEEGLKVPLDDDCLRAALRPCHWDVEAAFKRLKCFYAFKSRHPHVGRPLTPARVGPVAGSGVVCILPRRDQRGRRILLMQTGRKWNPKKVSMDEILCAVIMFLEIALMEPDTQVSGVVIIWDLDGLTLSQVLKFSPSFAKMLLHLIQDCIPMRIKAFHFVNQSNLFDIAFNVFKPFLRDKLHKRLFFHGRNMSSLADHVDPKVLPKQYGGVYDFTLDPDELVAIFRKLEKFFEELRKFGYEKPTK